MPIVRRLLDRMPGCLPLNLGGGLLFYTGKQALLPPLWRGSIREVTMAIHRHNAGIAAITLIFVLIFISQQTALVALAGERHGGQFGLMLFMLASIFGALLAGNNKLVHPLLGGVMAAAIYWPLPATVCGSR
ncbi:hypothetical protein D8L93_01355 [Sodalis-like symbiont of Bactericera trigonica]|nr:hypothetical protein D8L93_01355 [Sodalis-like symbiont of Bactericera trigonica]